MHGVSIVAPHSGPAATGHSEKLNDGAPGATYVNNGGLPPPSNSQTLPPSAQKPHVYIYTGHSHLPHGHTPMHLAPGQHGEHGPHHLSFERKCLLAATSATVIGLTLMIVAVTTDYWLILTNPGGAYLSHDKMLRLSSHSGIWRICNIDFHNQTQRIWIDTVCKRHVLFPSDMEAHENKHEFDATSLNYTRSEVAFSTIALVLMIIGQGFAFYSFKERRYMFKRLTGFLHLLSAICVLICIEVLVSSVTYEQNHLPARHPATAVSHYGFSFVLACVTCAAYFAAGVIFLFFSRKQKSDKTITEMKTMDEDEEDQADADAPIALGR